MPYYIHAKDVALPETVDEASDLEHAIGPFATAQEAHERRQTIQVETSDRCIVSFVPTNDQREDWQRRERRRFNSGEYVNVPWYRPTFYSAHYAHLSVKHPGLIAYTKNDEHGVADRQTAIKPGRYLAEFYGPDSPLASPEHEYHSYRMSKDEIDSYVAACGAEMLALRITRDPAEIEHIYTHGPRSCMSRHASMYQGHCHPSRVYGGPHSDLAVAYTGDLDGSTSARAVVWPERKIAVRAYPDKQCKLAHILRANGYALYDYGSYDTCLRGARIAAIKDRNGNGWIMPYIDGIDWASLSDDGKSFVLLADTDNERVGCQTTQEYDGDTIAAGVSEPCDRDEDDDDFTCDQCHGRCHVDDYAGDSLCQSCHDEVFRTCDECEESIDTRDVSLTDIGRHGRDRHHNVCDQCAAELQQTCSHGDCNETWYADDGDDHGPNDALCSDCADRYEECPECGNYTVNGSETCDKCGETIRRRCAHTAELPLMADGPIEPTAPATPANATETLYRVELRGTVDHDDPCGLIWTMCYKANDANNDNVMAIFDNVTKAYVYVRDMETRYERHYRVVLHHDRRVVIYPPVLSVSGYHTPPSTEDSCAAF